LTKQFLKLLIPCSTSLLSSYLKAISHRISSAIEKSVPAWRLRNFSILFQVVRQYSNYSCSLFILTKKVINCQQTDLNCGMALCADG
jgi:hypothetical protein